MYTHINLLCFVKKEMLKTINQCTTVVPQDVTVHTSSATRCECPH